jgi:hypothetical protein
LQLDKSFFAEFDATRSLSHENLGLEAAKILLDVIVEVDPMKIVETLGLAFIQDVVLGALLLVLETGFLELMVQDLDLHSDAPQLIGEL